MCELDEKHIYSFQSTNNLQTRNKMKLRFYSIFPHWEFTKFGKLLLRFQISFIFSQCSTHRSCFLRSNIQWFEMLPLKLESLNLTIHMLRLYPSFVQVGYLNPDRAGSKYIYAIMLLANIYSPNTCNFQVIIILTLMIS